MSIDLQRILCAKESVLLVGPPGIGKTARVASMARAAGYRLVVMRASLSERVDFGGALVPDMAAGVTRALPLDTLADLRSTPRPTLLFLDDLGQAPMDVQAACMRLFDPGYLSSNVVIWGATNRPGDKAGVTALCEPLRSRFALAFAVPTPQAPASDAVESAIPLGTWADEVDRWAAWAMDNQASATMIAWHRATTGRTLYAWRPHADPAIRMPDYRSWATVVRLESQGLADIANVAAAIGRPAAVEYTAFAALAEQVPAPQDIWRDPHGARVPSEPNALWLVATSLGMAAEPEHAAQLVAYASRMPRMFAALAVRDAYRRLGASLARSRAWSQWFADNQELFTAQ